MNQALSERRLAALWNAQADQFIQWVDLGLDEKQAFTAEVVAERAVSGQVEPSEGGSNGHQ